MVRRDVEQTAPRRHRSRRADEKAAIETAIATGRRAVTEQREPWRSWARLMPPRQPRGDGRNIVRQLVAIEIFNLSDDERDLVADAVEAIEQDRDPPVKHDLLTIALAIVRLRREHPDAWA